jgi:hypothetical protein
VHVGDRPLLLVGPGQHRRQQLGTRENGVDGALAGRARSRPDRVERRHPSTVTPRGNQRVERITFM